MITQGFAFRSYLPRNSADVSVTALLKRVNMESRSTLSSTNVAIGAILPPTCSCLESTPHCGIIAPIEIEPDSYITLTQEIDNH